MSKDLRVLKTKQGIKEAFLALRESRPVNKISIKQLCEDALINKSTFYTYYTDIYDLESQLKSVAIDNVFERLSYKDYLFTNPALFIEHLPDQTPIMVPEIACLFRDDSDELFERMESKLITYYTPTVAEPEEKIRLAFIIGGMMSAMKHFLQSKQYSAKMLEENITKIIDSLT